MTKNEYCLICNSARLRQLPRYYEKHELIQCRQCGFVFMENIPSAEQLTRHYSKYSYREDGQLSSMTASSYNHLLDEFEKYRLKNKILDVGCGRGWFLQEAKKRGWEVYGTEYSAAAIKICEAAGLHMKPGKLEKDTFPEETFDVITSFEVIEHINNPVEEISNIHRYLRAGGLFYCTTPNFNSYLRYYLKEDYSIIDYPEHLSYYTKSTLKRLMKKNRFRPVKFLVTGISITRLKTTKKVGELGVNTQDDSDERLRQQIGSKWYLGYAKRIVNYLLTVSGLGMTLKGYFMKP